jgi:tetratricopeptide (TPR) repeat protein
MKSEWELRVADFWLSADDSKTAETLATMKALVEELDPSDPDALFEWASVHDFLGLEVQAVPLYKQALSSGLSGLKYQKAVIQLASSLRNIGKPEEAVTLLESNTFDVEMGDAAKAFLALSYFDAGNAAKAISIALGEFYPGGAIYARSVNFYAQALIERANSDN